MRPTTWNDLPNIHDVPPLDDSDRQCLEDIRAVVERHGKAKRFGVTVLHQHFLMAEDEVLVEHCDQEQRTLVTAPEKATEIIRREYLPTVWRFDGKFPQVCAYCPMHGNQHDGYKEPH